MAELLGSRVLVLWREPGDEMWLPHFEGRVVAESDRNAKVKRFWWWPAEWLPKDGPFCRIAEIHRPRDPRG